MEGEAATAGPGRSWLVISVLLLAVLMAVLPALAALWLVPGAAPTAAALAGLLVALLTGGKLAASAWGLVSKGSEPRFRAPV
jgi:hypothetical protein